MDYKWTKDFIAEENARIIRSVAIAHLETLGEVDTAIPQSQWDLIHEETGENIQGHAVYFYPVYSNIRGGLVPITVFGRILMLDADIQIHYDPLKELES